MINTGWVSSVRTAGETRAAKFFLFVFSSIGDVRGRAAEQDVLASHIFLQKADGRLCLCCSL